MAEPIDVLLNLARVAPDELVALAALVRPGGVVVNTVPTKSSTCRASLRSMPLRIACVTSFPSSA